MPNCSSSTATSRTIDVSGKKVTQRNSSARAGQAPDGQSHTVEVRHPAALTEVGEAAFFVMRRRSWSMCDLDALDVCGRAAAVDTLARPL
jgi:hypothetical protein